MEAKLGFINHSSTVPDTVKKSDYYSSGSDDDLPPTTSILGVSGSSLEQCESDHQLACDDIISISTSAGKRAGSYDTQQGRKRAKTQKSDPEKQLKKEALEKERQEKKRLKEEEKARKAAEREAKKQKKMLEVARKKALQQARKITKPGECLKHVTVMLDTQLIQQGCSKAVLEELQNHDVRYEVQQQAVSHLVTWWREVTQLKDTPGGGITTDATEKMEDQLLVLLPQEDFVNLVYNFVQQKMGPSAGNNKTLRSYVIETKLSLENRPLTLVVQGMDKYWRNQRIQKAKNANKKNMTLPEVSRLQVEEALLDIQIQEGCNVRLLENDVDVGKLVFSFTKAVAETPFKQERLKTGLSFFMEGGASVKIDKDGKGIRQAWRQMLQQFKNVTADIANAIIAQYPSPCDLHQAYEACRSSKEAELLLQDILVRRGVGVTETTRRVGKELSRRLWELFTQKDPEHIIR